MAQTIVGNIDIVCERQSERDYFWAIAFEIDADLVVDWQEFVKPPLLFFEEIHQMISDFDEFVDGGYEIDRLEAFIAGQIWIAKFAAGSVLNPEFLPYLQLSPLARCIEGKEGN